MALTVTGMALAIRESGKFGDSFNEISTLVHTTDENLKQFRANILDYSRDSKQSLDDINSAVYTAISAGIDYANSLDVISQAERLAIAGRADLEPTTRLLATTLNAYGESTDQAQKYSDVFFKTVEKGLTTIPELADSLARVTGIASTAKIPIESLMAAIAALTATGMSTEEATTGLRAAINNIISPSTEAAKTAKELGIQFNAEALASRGLENVLREVYQATGGNVEVMSQLFGNVRALNPALILGADNAGIFKSSLEAMANAAGATEEAYGKMADNFAFINQTLANNIKATLVGLGDQLTDNYKDVAEGMGKILKAIGEAIDKGAFTEIFKALDNFGEQVKDFLGKVAEALPEALSRVDYSHFIDSLKELGMTISGIFDGLDLTTPEGLAEAIQEVVDIITTLQYIMVGMADFFVDIFDALRGGASAMNTTGKEAKEMFGQILAGAMLVKEAGIVVAGAFLVMRQSGVDWRNMFLKIIEEVKLAYNALVILMDTGAYLIAGAFKIFMVALQVLTFGMVDSINNASNALSEFMAGATMDIDERGQKMAESLHKMEYGFGDVADQAKEASLETKEFSKEIATIPDEKTVEFAASWQERFAEIEKEKMQRDFPDQKQMAIIPDLDADSTAKTKEIIKKELPDYRLLEIEARIDESLFKEQTKRMESYLDYKAKVDIAEIESATRQIEAVFNSVNTTIEGTGELLGTLFGQLADMPYSGYQTRAIEDQIRIENERRTEALRLQTELTQSQLDYLEAKKDAMARGEGLFTVQCDGLKPHLEAILWEIVEAARFRVNQEHGEFLMGI